MNDLSERIRELRELVRAASEEFDTAITFHESWRPAAYDKALHERIGRSYAGNTFLVIRQALRREMLLALARIWDTNKNAVRMSKIASELDDRTIIDALAAECAAQWGKAQPIIDFEDIPAAEHAAIIEQVQANEGAFGFQMAVELRERATRALTMIRKYQEGGSGHATLQVLMNLRHERLAHRQLKVSTSAEMQPEADAAAIEGLYEDMAALVSDLLHVVLLTSYDPKETAEIFQYHARFFWASVRGERTEGHPNFTGPVS